MKNNAKSPYEASSKDTFFAIGLNYKKADAEVRGRFSVSENVQKDILIASKQSAVRSLTLISTCNRTELYGFAQKAKDLVTLLCEHTTGSISEFEKVAYVYQDQRAVSHLFKVGTGLDSQI